MEQKSSTQDVNEFVFPKKVRTLFQPVVSIDDKQVLGFEAFSRGILEEESGEQKVIGLFEEEVAPPSLFDLDRVCCRATLVRFQKFLKKWGNLSVFLNLDVRALSSGCCEEHFILDVVKNIDVPLNNIVIEISAETLEEKDTLGFIEFCRKKGFQISIDKVEHNSRLLSVLLQAKPDFIKLQRSIWSNPEDVTFNLGNLEYVVRNCTSVDCVPIALGVETEEEALYLLQAKIYAHQGYYYTRNDAAKNGGSDTVQGFLATVELINAKFKKLQAERITARKEHFLHVRTQMKKISSIFADVSEDKFDALIKRILRKYEDVISIFVIDEHGTQVTLRMPRKFSKEDLKQVRAVKTKGADHSMRDYYIHLLMGYENFVTPPQLSPFSDAPTVIVSFRFFSGIKSFHLLCVEFPAA